MHAFWSEVFLGLFPFPRLGDEEPTKRNFLFPFCFFEVGVPKRCRPKKLAPLGHDKPRPCCFGPFGIIVLLRTKLSLWTESFLSNWREKSLLKFTDLQQSTLSFCFEFHMFYLLARILGEIERGCHKRSNSKSDERNPKKQIRRKLTRDQRVPFLSVLSL